ncbi:MAG: YggS family pyridoxal phosphate-dependent enzyme [Candidatus Omnitrophica bacterium]|jgi:hypothetical protein|nr:YggS family pyridoxal phosphate-dependent enzyme [Candidatus Omnitrophota bacterium]
MVKNAIIEINKRITRACLACGRDPRVIRLVAVSKTAGIAQIEEALACGITDLGESRVQDAVSKFNAIRTTQYAGRASWQMIGHLQTNKVKEAVEIFDLIHSVDSLRLAGEIGRQAARINKVQDILIEVKTSAEAAKFGFPPEEAVLAAREISKVKNLRLLGLMTIAPFVEDPQQARPYFRQLRELLDQINAERISPNAVRELSMGMTNDFEAAIAEGATILRIGRAIFEPGRK